MRPYDVAVIGAGVAGSASAIWLARRGLRVGLFEKEKGARQKVCGEFLSAESAPYLENLGVSTQSLGAHRIHSFRLHGTERSCRVELPMPAQGLSRLVLDEALRTQAVASGAELARGVQVRSVEGPRDDAFTLQTSAGEVRARRLVVATGKHEFKALQERRGRDSAYVGFKTHLRLRSAARERLSGHCDLFVFPQGYGGLAMVENDLANLCFLIKREALASVGSDWPSLSAHIARANRHAAAYLAGAEPATESHSERNLLAAISGIPYGFIRRAPAQPGVYLVGDQFAVIPSLTGDGMSIALMTARLAVDAILDSIGDATESYQLRARSALAAQVAVGFYAHRLFRHPRACDVTAALLQRFPAVGRWFFLATRSPRPGPRS